MTLNASAAAIDTYFLTEANFVDVLASPYNLASIQAVSQQYEGITIFSIANNLNVYSSWDGYKAQPWPAAAFSEMYRFEAGDKAMGYIYNKTGTDAAKWIDELVTLKGAMSGLSTATISVITALALHLTF